MVVVQCAKHSPWEDVGEYVVDDGEKINQALIPNVGLITFLVEYDNSCVLPRALDMFVR